MSERIRQYDVIITLAFKVDATSADDAERQVKSLIFPSFAPHFKIGGIVCTHTSIGEGNYERVMGLEGKGEMVIRRLLV